MNKFVILGLAILGLISLIIVYQIDENTTAKKTVTINHLIPYKFEGEIICQLISNPNYRDTINNNILSIEYEKNGIAQIPEQLFKNKTITEEHFFWIKDNGQIIDSISIVDLRINDRSETAYLITNRINSEKELSDKLKSFPLDKFEFFNPILISTDLNQKWNFGNTAIEYNKTKNQIKYTR